MTTATGHRMFASAMEHLTNGTAPHVTRYLQRLDEFLAALPDQTSRRGFLGDEHKKWQYRYQRWQARVDAGEETDPDVTAWDFVETMSELDKRIAQELAE